MSKPSPRSSIDARHALLAAWIFLAAHGTAIATGVQGPFFRFANLSPLGTPQLDLFCGDNPLALQTNPGFFMGYTPLPPGPAKVFSLREGGKTLSTAPMPDAKESNFFTVLATSDGSKIQLEVLDDTPAFETNPATGEKKPLKRLRVFSGPYKIPSRIDAGELGNWTTRTGHDALRGEKVFESTGVDSVKVTFVDDQQAAVDLFYPVDFTAHNQFTVLVSQRGPQRLRVTAVPDAVPPPLEEPAPAVQP